MSYSPILAPVVALVAWTLVMLVWLAIARRRAFAKMGISWGSIPRGSRGVNLDGRAPDEAQWPSHNYNHLMEQPTIFYALVFYIVLSGHTDATHIYSAWAYVALRAAHTLVQGTINVVPMRFLLFTLSTLALMVMAAREIIALL